MTIVRAADLPPEDVKRLPIRDLDRQIRRDRARPPDPNAPHPALAFLTRVALRPILPFRAGLVAR